MKFECEDMLGKLGGAFSIAVSLRWAGHREPRKLQSEQIGYDFDRYIVGRGLFMFKARLCLIFDKGLIQKSRTTCFKVPGLNG